MAYLLNSEYFSFLRSFSWENINYLASGCILSAQKEESTSLWKGEIATVCCVIGSDSINYGRKKTIRSYGVSVTMCTQV